MSFLEDLLASTKARVAEAKTKITEEVLEQRAAAVGSPRGFREALATDGIAIIAEIKRATPSAGLLKADLDPRALAAAFREGGAAALSVLTEPEHFQGSNEDLEAVREAGLPVLRKDFTIDAWQVLEARALGADAVLLIARILGDSLGDLHRTTQALGMDALVEVFDRADLDAALDVGAPLIGINHRDLETFEVDPDRTAKLAPMIGDAATLVALSGVSTREQVRALADAGAQAVLVGESLVTAADPAAALRELLA